VYKRDSRSSCLFPAKPHAPGLAKIDQYVLRVGRLTVSFQSTNAHVQRSSYAAGWGKVRLVACRVPVNQVEILSVRGNDVPRFNVVMDDAEVVYCLQRGDLGRGFSLNEQKSAG